MPFTVAHAAAAAPIWHVTGKRLVLSALVIGCLSPDVEYFVQLRVRRTISHEWYGILLLDLPLSLLMLWLLHRVIKRPLLLLLPERLAYLRMIGERRFEFFPLGRFCNVCGSILLGAVSHVIWDSTTHRGGWTVQQIPLLQQTLLTGTPLEKPVYTYLQNGCGALGLAFLLWWAIRALQQIPTQCHLPRARRVMPPKARVAVLLALAAFALSTGAANALVSYRSGSDTVVLKQAVIDGVVGLISGGFAAMLVYAAFVTLRRREWLDENAGDGAA